MIIVLKIVKTEKEFDETIKKGQWLVDFYAEWCGPCRMLAPIVEELSQEYNVLKVDTDSIPAIAVRYGIMSIPTIMVFQDGKEVSKSVGFLPKEEIIKMLRQ